MPVPGVPHDLREQERCRVCWQKATLSTMPRRKASSKTLKTEEVYLKEYPNFTEAHDDLGPFIEAVYNQKRGCTPRSAICRPRSSRPPQSHLRPAAFPSSERDCERPERASRSGCRVRPCPQLRSVTPCRCPIRRALPRFALRAIVAAEQSGALYRHRRRAPCADQKIRQMPQKSARIVRVLPRHCARHLKHQGIRRVRRRGVFGRRLAHIVPFVRSR
jgi:hypothetical protein